MFVCVVGVWCGVVVCAGVVEKTGGVYDCVADRAYRLTYLNILKNDELPIKP